MKTTATIFLMALVLGFSACSERDAKNNTSTNSQVNNVPANAPATGNPAGNTALNPPHGEPGHRCDIEVGAPLNTPVQPTLTTPPPVFQPQATGSVAAGTNPPHGQPGHDCAIPVGAPLPK